MATPSPEQPKESGKARIFAPATPEIVLKSFEDFMIAEKYTDSTKKLKRTAVEKWVYLNYTGSTSKPRKEEKTAKGSKPKKEAKKSEKPSKK